MIPLSEPYLSGNEWTYIKECLDTNWVSSAGSFVDKFERAVADYTKSPFAIATNSGTSALQLALHIIDVQADELVVMPNLTFVASANAIRYLGADPIFIDASANHWQMDINLLEDFLTTRCTLKEDSCIESSSGKRIAALLLVHVLGNMGEMDRIVALAKKWSLPLVEDSTEALGSTFDGKHAGTFGDIGCLSFNGNKIITSGGGGMLLTANPELAKRAKHLSTQAKVSGLDYYHDETGYNFRLVNILAALGLAQMEQLPYILHKKQQIAQSYQQALQGIRFPKVLAQTSPNFWLNTVFTPDKSGLIEYLAAQEIQSRPLWLPMNQLQMYTNCYVHSQQHISHHLYQHCVSLPSSPSLTAADQQKVTDEVQKYLGAYLK